MHIKHDMLSLTSNLGPNNKSLSRRAITNLGRPGGKTLLLALCLAVCTFGSSALYAQSSPQDPPSSQSGSTDPDSSPSNGPGRAYLVKRAGIGGPIGYARAGVLELGGSAGFSTNSHLTQFTLTPTIGWFLTNYLQLSALLNMTYVQADNELGNSSSSTAVSLLAEPSFHYPFSEMIYGFAGVGLGFAYQTGPGTGFALAPRAGINVLVGRSGIITPALSWQLDSGALEDAVRANIGYTVMW